MSKAVLLKPLDTELAFASSRSLKYGEDVKSPKASAYSKTPSSAFPKTPTSDAFLKTPTTAFPKTPKTPVDGIPNLRMLGRRHTTRSFDTGLVDQTEALAYDGEDDTLTRTGSFLYKIHSASLLARYSLYILPMAIILAIPVILTANPPHNNARADDIRLLGLFIWIEIIWVAVWISKIIGQSFPIVFQAACSLITTGVRKYSLVLKALEIPTGVFVWTILCYATTDVIYVFDKTAYQEQGRGKWITTLRHVCRTGIIAAAIFVLEKSVIQMISIDYYRRSYARKIRESKRLIQLLDLLYDTSRRLFPEFSKDFEHEDTMLHNRSLVGLPDGKDPGLGGRLLGRVKDKATSAFSSSTPAHSVVSKALENETASKALARRLWLSLCASGNDAIYKQDILEVLGQEREAEAEEIFNLLDRDGNGDVSLEEMTILIVNCGLERRDRASSIQDISSAIAVLDKILSLVVVVLIAVIYALFFSHAFANKAGSLFTSVGSLAFAIGGTVTEFFACCIFLFVKHPYDVGDRVEIEQQELIVKHISLMYSIFKRVDNDSIVQIPHNIANTLWINNITRSKAMKERLSIRVSFGTSLTDILSLRSELETFVTSPENRHDFLPDVDIELTSVGDLFYLELRVEIRHKSNWTNESIRLHRRNKFMCELNAALRRCQIERPGGNWGPANPTYVCEMTEGETSQIQRVKAEKHDQSRMPVYQSIGEVLTQAQQSPAQAMFPGLKKRSATAGEQVMGRRPSIWSPL